MLSRTADHLFWMARYMERAENTARMLDVQYQTSLMPEHDGHVQKGWDALLGISELHEAYHKSHAAIEGVEVMRFMVRDTANLSSIAACLSAARENARAVRGALTTELWETTNQTWLEFSRMLMSGVLERDPSAVFEWVKFRSHLCRGVAVGTMLQDEALCFIRIGTFLERSDNTARLLDVKFHGSGHEMAAPKWANKGAPANDAHTETDFYYWSALLRSLSAFEIYRRVYSSVILPEKVAELLILRPDMPRSLAACMHEVVNNLNLVANSQSQETCRKVGRLSSDLQFARIDEILDGGLHAFLTQFLARINDIGARISKDFLVAA